MPNRIYFRLSNIKLNNKFELNISEFPKGRHAIWETKYNFFIFRSCFTSSRIQSG
jgi:hypothetical protein